MYRDFYKLVEVDSAVSALILFLVMFASLLVYLYLPRRGRPTFDDVARLPLADGPDDVAPHAPAGDRHE